MKRKSKLRFLLLLVVRWIVHCLCIHGLRIISQAKRETENFEWLEETLRLPSAVSDPVQTQGVFGNRTQPPCIIK